MDIELISKAVVSMLVIASPFDAVKILFFNQAISSPPRGRTISAASVALRILIILGGAALAGREILELLGIDLDVFGAVGGIMIGLIGFRMAGGSGTGRKERSEEKEDAPDRQDALLVPLTLPLIVGPGTIATTIAISAQGEANTGVVAALIGTGVVALAAFVSYAWFGDILGRMKPATMTVVARLGGLLLVMIGAQMLLTGLKNFFA